VGAGFDEDLGADDGSGEDSEHDGHGDHGVDVAAGEIDAGAGGGGDADHEVTGGGGDFEGELHGLVHGEDFYGAGADAEEAGERSGAEHDSEAERDAGGGVLDFAAGVGVTAVEFEAGGEGVGGGGDVFCALAAEGGECGVEEDDAEDYGDPVAGDSGGEIGAEEGAEGGGDFEEHADADVGEAFADVGYGGSGGGGDDGDEGGSDGVADVYVEEEGEDGDDDDSATEAGESAQQAGEDRGAEEQGGEEEDGHVLSIVLEGVEDGRRGMRVRGVRFEEERVRAKASASANTGISPLRRKSAPSVEMTGFVGGEGERSPRDTTPFAKSAKGRAPRVGVGREIMEG